MNIPRYQRQILLVRVKQTRKMLSRNILIGKGSPIRDLTDTDVRQEPLKFPEERI